VPKPVASYMPAIRIGALRVYAGEDALTARPPCKLHSASKHELQLAHAERAAVCAIQGSGRSRAALSIAKRYGAESVMNRFDGC
jgi:hypothetical protein